MKVLLLSPYPEELLPIFREYDDDITVTEEPISPPYLKEHSYDLGVSYGYRHILKQELLDVLPFINMHISYLPWNKGADPNLWSWIENTPKGITIHHIDAGIDTGDIIAQQEISMDTKETLSSSYDKLQKAMIDLFAEKWPLIRTGKAERKPQQGNGSIHFLKDREKITDILAKGYDVTIDELLKE